LTITGGGPTFLQGTNTYTGGTTRPAGATLTAITPCHRRALTVNGRNGCAHHEPGRRRPAAAAAESGLGVSLTAGTANDRRSPPAHRRSLVSRARHATLAGATPTSADRKSPPAGCGHAASPATSRSIPVRASAARHGDRNVTKQRFRAARIGTLNITGTSPTMPAAPTRSRSRPRARAI